MPEGELFTEPRHEPPEFATPPEEQPGLQDLPTGVHPFDPAELVRDEFGSNFPVPRDTGGKRYKQGAPSFDTDAEDALAVFQRASQAWSGNGATITAAVQAVGRQRGRVSVSIWVPSTATNGVQIAPTVGEVEATSGEVVLNPGDSITIPTEAPVWVAPIPGQTSGTYQLVVTFNPAGGALGAL